MKALPIQTTVYTNLGFGIVTRAYLDATFYEVTFDDGYTCERRHSEVIEVVKGYTESDYKRALKAYDTAYFAFEGDTSEFNKTASDFLPKKVTTMKNKPTNKGNTMNAFLSITTAILFVAGLCLAADYGTKSDSINTVKVETIQTTPADDINNALKAEFCKDMGKGLYENASLIDAKGDNACK